MLRTIAWNSYAEAEPVVRPFLAARNRNPFLSFDWTAEYSRRIRAPYGWRPLPVGVFRGEQMVAFAPLSVRRGPGGVPVVAFNGEGRGAYLGVAGEMSTEVLAALRTELARTVPHAVLRWSDVVEGDPLLNCFDASSGLAAAHRTAVYPCPFRDLRPDAPPDSTSHKTFQKRIPGYAKRLARFGEVRHLLLDFDAARQESLDWLPRLFALHDLRHGTRRNPWTDPGNREFLAAWLAQAERTDCLCFVLLLDSMPVAFDLGFRIEASFCLHIPAFHTAFEKYRLGHINRFYSFALCRELGIEIYDFARGDAFAKRIWASGVRDNFELVAAVDSSLRSRVAAGTMAAKARAMVWCRHHGLSRSKLTLWWNHWFRGTASARPVVPGFAGKVPLRYGLLAGLPVEMLTRMAEFVSAQPPSSEISVEWTGPETLRVSGSQPVVELALDAKAGRG